MRLIDADELIKQTEQTYCTGCNNYNKVKCKACPTGDMLDDLDNAPTVDLWHYPSKGEYPPSEKLVLCLLWEAEFAIGCFDIRDKSWNFKDIDGREIDLSNEYADNITAWMPLPEPPKERA